MNTAPVLSFTHARCPAPVLLSGPSHVIPAAGGPPLRVLRDRAAVLAALGHGHVPAASVGPPTAHVITGAERQSRDGGLLNMHGRALRWYRARTGAVLTARAAELERGFARATARVLAARVGDGTDLVTGFAEPFTRAVVMHSLGLGTGWDAVHAGFTTAFAPVNSAADVPAVDAAWADLYRFWWPTAAGRTGVRAGTAARVAGLLHGDRSPDQITHVLGNISNGYPAIGPVLARAVWEMLSGAPWAGSWQATADWLLATVCLFPIALPRVTPGGERVLPVLAAAAAGGPADWRVAFGPGAHFCPGAHLARMWLTEALRALFTTCPGMTAAPAGAWTSGTLTHPARITVTGVPCHPARRPLCLQ